jgi:molybdate transport system permease protein
LDWQAARVSLALAAASVVLLVVPALWLARWLARTSWRGRAVIEAALTLPLMLPPTVLGFYFLSAFGSQSAAGRWLAQGFGVQLVFSFTGLLVASLFINLPFMVQPIQRAFAAVPASVREAAWVSGLGRAATFWRIELPLAWPGVLAGCALTFAHTLGEFGVVMMIGGSIPGSTRTLSIAIYDRVQLFDTDAAAHMSLLLLAFSLAAITVVFLAGQRERRSRTG